MYLAMYVGGIDTCGSACLEKVETVANDRNISKKLKS